MTLATIVLVCSLRPAEFRTNCETYVNSCMERAGDRGVTIFKSAMDCYLNLYADFKCKDDVLPLEEPN